MSFGWKPYVSVAERRRSAERAAAQSRNKGLTLSPVTARGGAIAKTFWGKAWCDNLERYSDFSNRLPRGRTYVRNGSVIDLVIAQGGVQAQVMGSHLYKVAVSVSSVPNKHWQAIGVDCAGSIDSLVELLQGRLSKGVMERICRPQTGLFPAPSEITFTCSCPDWAVMCKHVAAALYGVGARLDERPELLFTLRRVDAKDLVARAETGLSTTKKGPAAGKVLDSSLLAEVFGIELAEAAIPAARGKIAAVGKKPPVPKKPARKKPPVPKKPPAAKKPAGKRPPVATKPPEPKQPPGKLTTAIGTRTQGAAPAKRKRGGAKK
jgi:uncharacterized Zn finger protein